MWLNLFRITDVSRTVFVLWVFLLASSLVDGFAHIQIIARWDNKLWPWFIPQHL